MTETPQTITIPATELNLRAGNVLRRVAVDRQHIIIQRNGYPIAVMIPFHDYQPDDDTVQVSAEKHPDR